jgi:hypothetical protein
MQAWILRALYSFFQWSDLLAALVCCKQMHLVYDSSNVWKCMLQRDFVFKNMPYAWLVAQIEQRHDFKALYRSIIFPAFQAQDLDDQLNEDQNATIPQLLNLVFAGRLYHLLSIVDLHRTCDHDKTKLYLNLIWKCRPGAKYANAIENIDFGFMAHHYFNFNENRAVRCMILAFESKDSQQFENALDILEDVQTTVENQDHIMSCAFANCPSDLGLRHVVIGLDWARLHHNHGSLLKAVQIMEKVCQMPILQTADTLFQHCISTLARLRLHARQMFVPK